MNQYDGVGDILKQSAPRWSVLRDARTGTWWILDLWHESLTSLNPDSEVPNDSPAYTVLPSDAFEKLITEAARLGFLQKALGNAPPTFEGRDSPGVSPIPLPYPMVSNSADRDSYFLKKQALEAVTRIVGLHSTEELGNLD